LIELTGIKRSGDPRLERIARLSIQGHGASILTWAAG
jgi:hypothetical protein